MREEIRKELKAGILGVSVLAIGMLAYALYGRPAYAFYSMLRLTVVIAAASGAWALFRISKYFLPLSVCLVLVGGLHLFGRMRKSQWIIYNEGAAALLLAVVVILGIDLLRRKESPDEP